MKVFFTISIVFFSASLYLHAAPEISVDKSRIDFGNFPANQEQSHVFTLINSGDKELEILKVRKTCGCSKTELGKNHLSPGEKTTLHVFIKAESISGPFNKSIFVQSNDPKQRFLLLSLNGKSIPLLTVKPKDKIYAGTLKPGSLWTQDFLIESSIKGVKLAQPECADNVQTRLSLVQSKDGNYRLKVQINIPSASKANSFNSKLYIKILSPSNWKPLEISLYGRISK